PARPLCPRAPGALREPRHRGGSHQSHARVRRSPSHRNRQPDRCGAAGRSGGECRPAMSRNRPRQPERSFGISVGGVLCVVAAVLAWRGRVTRAEWVGGLGAVLLFLGLVRPLLLAPISDVWWRASAALGRFNARVLLSIFFALVLTPVGLLWRL